MLETGVAQRWCAGTGAEGTGFNPCKEIKCKNWKIHSVRDRKQKQNKDAKMCMEGRSLI